ncbi:MAG: zinc-ribbon domain-containing protein [Candidatus Izemoplasmatales bacterium]
MEYCSQCGNEIDVYDKYCSQCGNQAKKSSMYESQTIYNRGNSRKTNHSLNYGTSTIFGIIAFLLSLLNLISFFFGGFISFVFAITAIVIYSSEKRRGYYSQLGFIFGVIAIALNFLAFLIPIGFRVFFQLF